MKLTIQLYSFKNKNDREHETGGRDSGAIQYLIGGWAFTAKLGGSGFGKCAGCDTANKM